MKLENDDFEYNEYDDYDSDEIDTKEHLLEEFEYLESEVASNSSEAPTVNINRGRLYGCKRCNLEFQSVNDTFKHRTKFHARRKPYMCLICRIKFPGTKKYTCHMQKHAINKYLYCSMCRVMFEKKRDHSAHMLSHLKTTTFCQKCKKYFRFKSDYRQHLNKFRKTYFCHICNNNFFYLKCYQRHMITHLRYDKLMKNLQHYRNAAKRCLIIKKNETQIKINFVSTPVKYRFHRSIYRSSVYRKLYKCYKCLTTYSSRSNLNKYIMFSTRRHLFKCPLCRLGYCNSKMVPSPAGNHVHKKLFSCHVCNLKFSDKKQKEKHTHDLRLTKLNHDRNVVHQAAPTKKFLSCDVCKWNFPDLIGLKTHIYFSHF